MVTALWLLTACYIRVGNEKYLKENSTHGLLTLHKKHIKMNSKNMHLDFIGKKKVRNTYSVQIPSASFAKWLKTLHSKATPFYFQYNGRRITSSDLNAYIQTHYGAFTAKDFRTWGANIEFLKEIKKIKPSTMRTLINKKECQRSLKSCVENVSNKLNNTIAVCKSNYICKAIMDEYQSRPIEFIKKVKKSRSFDALLLNLLKNLT